MSLINTLKICWFRWRAWRGLRPPIFVVGCGHSGTSLLRSVMGFHSRIHSIEQETNFAAKKTKRMWQMFLAFRKETLAAGKVRWLEKTPKHVHRISLLLSLHPRSRVIVIVRDGRDVALSLAKRFGSLAKGTERWVNDNRAALQFVDEPRVTWVKYEDLVSKFDSTISAVLASTGEAYEPSIAELAHAGKGKPNDIPKLASRTGEDHKRYREWQLRQPIFDGRGRFRELSAEQIEQVELVQGELLRTFGYIDTDEGSSEVNFAT